MLTADGWVMFWQAITTLIFVVAQMHSGNTAITFSLCSFCSLTKCISKNAQHSLWQSKILRFFFRLFAPPMGPTGHEQLNWQNTHTAHIPTEKQSCVIPSQCPYQPLRHTKDLHPCRWKFLCLNIHSLAWKESHNSSKLDTVISAGREREKKTEPIHNFSGREKRNYSQRVWQRVRIYAAKVILCLFSLFARHLHRSIKLSCLVHKFRKCLSAHLKKKSERNIGRVVYFFIFSCLVESWHPSRVF